MNILKHITVILAEDHMILREGLIKLLENEKDIEIVGEAKTGRQAVEMAQKLNPEVIVMDIAMPKMNGLEATRQILKNRSETKVLILSAHSDEAYVERVMSLGALGYLLKQTSAHFLADAIREVQKGRTFFSPVIARRLSKLQQADPRRLKPTAMANIKLSSREMELLQLIAEGEANKQMADELSISIKTVEKHRSNLMQKLDIHDTAGLTRYAIETGIIECSIQSTTL